MDSLAYRVVRGTVRDAPASARMSAGDCCRRDLKICLNQGRQLHVLSPHSAWPDWPDPHGNNRLPSVERPRNALDEVAARISVGHVSQKRLTAAVTCVINSWGIFKAGPAHETEPTQRTNKCSHRRLFQCSLSSLLSRSHSQECWIEDQRSKYASSPSHWHHCQPLRPIKFSYGRL